MTIAASPINFSRWAATTDWASAASRPIGGEQLRVVGGPAAFDGDQGVEKPP
jgi:hypothetical protein